MPSGSKAAYEAADYWKEFKEIVEMDEEQTDPDPSTLDDTDISQLDNVAYIEKQERLVGKQLVLPVKMKNTMEVQGFQFDLVLPEGVTVAEDEDGFLQLS